MAAVASETIAATRHTLRARRDRRVAARASSRSESHPPAKPPSAANANGIQEYAAAAASDSRCTSTKYDTVKLVQNE